MCFGCICCGKPKKSGKAPDAQFTKECLSTLNSCRSVHGVPSLSYNRDIERVAQEWADHLARVNGFSHNSKATYKGQNLGENIASKWSSNREDYQGAQPVEQWYKEIERYDFKTYSGPKTGHFTQVVWKGSKEVGIGRAQSNDGTWIVVANFYPAGNYVGQHESNVFPAKRGKTPKFLTANPTGTTDPKGTPSKGTAAKGSTDRVTSSSSASKTTTRREVRTEKIGNVTKTTTTETTSDTNGVVTEKITEKMETPGSKTKTKITETVTKADGKKSTKTSNS